MIHWFVYWIYHPGCWYQHDIFRIPLGILGTQGIWWHRAAWTTPIHTERPTPGGHGENKDGHIRPGNGSETYYPHLSRVTKRKEVCIEEGCYTWLGCCENWRAFMVLFGMTMKSPILNDEQFGSQQVVGVEHRQVIRGPFPVWVAPWRKVGRWYVKRRQEMREMKIFLDWDCLIHVDPNEALFELDHPVKARTSKDAPRRLGFYGIYVLGIYGMKLAYQACKWMGLEDDAFPIPKWSPFQGTC